MTTVVFGEALVDDFLTEQIVGGAPFNVARHLAAFMSPQLMITRIGDDRNGATVRGEFERFAMSEAGLQVDQMEETGRVVVERGPKGHKFAILPRQAYDFINPEKALAALDLNLREGQYDERVVFHSMHAADIAKVNEEELQSLFRWYFDIHLDSPPLAADEVRAACGALVQMFSLEGLIVTLGHRGSVYFGAGGDVIVTRDTPAPPYVIDTVGAGDAFSAMFLLGRKRGWELEQTLVRANEYAAAICAIPGAVPRDIGFYDKWVARWRAG